MTAEIMEMPDRQPQYNEEDLRAAVEQLKKDGMSYSAQAKEAGIKYGSFTNWVGGTYEGNTQRVAGQVSAWLAARTERVAAIAKVRVAPDFVATPTALDIITQLTYAQAAPDMMVVVGVPGTGKTKACKQYQKTNPNVFLLTALDTVKSAYGMLDELATVVDVNERRTTRLNRAIGTKLKGKKALIIVDEAQHLSTGALDELRSLHDLWDCGIALVGDTRLHTRINGKGREGNLAQLSSRIGMRLKLLKPRTEDIAMLAAEWGILDPKVMRLIQKIGARDGGLRIMTKVLKLAAISAAGGGDDGLSEAAIMHAFNQLEHSVAA